MAHALEARIPTLRVLLARTSVDHTLWVDDALVATGGRDANLMLDPGSHRVEVRRPGKAPDQRTFVLSEGQELALDLDEACKLRRTRHEHASMPLGDAAPWARIFRTSVRPKASRAMENRDWHLTLPEDDHAPELRPEPNLRRPSSDGGTMPGHGSAGDAGVSDSAPCEAEADDGAASDAQPGPVLECAQDPHGFRGALERASSIP
jgi:hypothetical protein